MYWLGGGSAEDQKELVVYRGGMELLNLVALFGDLETQKDAAGSFAHLAVSGTVSLGIDFAACGLCSRMDACDGMRSHDGMGLVCRESR